MPLTKIKKPSIHKGLAAHKIYHTKHKIAKIPSKNPYFTPKVPPLLRRQSRLIDINPLRDFRYWLRHRYVLRTPYAQLRDWDLYPIEWIIRSLYRVAKQYIDPPHRVVLSDRRESKDLRISSAADVDFQRRSFDYASLHSG